MKNKSLQPILRLKKKRWTLHKKNFSDPCSRQKTNSIVHDIFMSLNFVRERSWSPEQHRISDVESTTFTGSSSACALRHSDVCFTFVFYVKMHISRYLRVCRNWYTPLYVRLKFLRDDAWWLLALANAAWVKLSYLRRGDVALTTS